MYAFSTPQQSFFQKDFLNLLWPAELAKQYLDKRQVSDFETGVLPARSVAAIVYNPEK